MARSRPYRASNSGKSARGARNYATRSFYVSNWAAGKKQSGNWKAQRPKR